VVWAPFDIEISIDPHRVDEIAPECAGNGHPDSSAGHAGNGPPSNTGLFPRSVAGRYPARVASVNRLHDAQLDQSAGRT